MEDLKKKSTSMLLDVWERGDYSVLRDICIPTVKRRHDRVPANDIEEYIQVVEFYRSAFSDLKYTIESIFGEQNRVAIVYSVSGTHTGPLGSIPPTGKRPTIGCIDVYTFSEGRIAEISTAFDELGLLIELGAVRVLP